MMPSPEFERVRNDRVERRGLRLRRWSTHCGVFSCTMGWSKSAIPARTATRIAHS